MLTSEKQAIQKTDVMVLIDHRKLKALPVVLLKGEAVIDMRGVWQL